MPFNANRKLSVGTAENNCAFHCLADMIINSSAKIPGAAQKAILEGFHEELAANNKVVVEYENFDALIIALKDMPVVEREAMLGSVLRRRVFRAAYNASPKKDGKFVVEEARLKELEAPGSLKNLMQEDEIAHIAYFCGMNLAVYHGEQCEHNVLEAGGAGEPAFKLENPAPTFKLWHPGFEKGNHFSFEAPENMTEGAITAHNAAFASLPKSTSAPEAPKSSAKKPSSMDMVDELMKKVSSSFSASDTKSGPLGSMTSLFKSIFEFIGPLMKIFMGIASMVNEMTEGMEVSKPQPKRGHSTPSTTQTQREQSQRMANVKAAHEVRAAQNAQQHAVPPPGAAPAAQPKVFSGSPPSSPPPSPPLSPSSPAPAYSPSSVPNNNSGSF